jgi:putative dehydrogenase
MSDPVKSFSRTFGPVGVIGLGNMGLAMAVNLVGSGFEVIGTDLIAESRNALGKAGGTAVADTGKVGKRCRHIILSLPSEAALHAVCADLSASGTRGTIVIETGTLPLTAKRKAYDLLAGCGITLLDCPLSGTGAQARNRDLAVYASGNADAIRECLPIIDGFARDLTEVANSATTRKQASWTSPARAKRAAPR